jgi:hypothetical protein
MVVKVSFCAGARGSRFGVRYSGTAEHRRPEP